MNKNMAKWVRALESGRYKQGREALRPKKDRYCCLGVACDVYRKSTKRGKWVPGNNDSMKFMGSAARLPVPVAKWLGLGVGFNAMDPALDGRPASVRNDDDRWSFKRIARQLREDYP